MPTQPKIAVIAGATATGKTALGAAVALALDGEVVSADSMQIYRGMDIGTAKVKPEETLGVPHHMTDIAEPDEAYSAAKFAEAADRCIREVLARGKLPVLVGGTGLYLDSVISGRQYDEEAFDPQLRAELTERYEALGGEKMLAELAAFDPDRASSLHARDKKRILRAIEVYKLTGRTITEHDEETKKAPDRYDAAKIVLTCKDRGELYERIDARVDAMRAAGLTREVKGLLECGVSEGATSMQAIGYKELIRHLKGEISEDEAYELIKRESRRYAKRQLTWFRRWSDALWIELETVSDFERGRQLATEFITAHGIK